MYHKCRTTKLTQGDVKGNRIRGLDITLDNVKCTVYIYFGLGNAYYCCEIRFRKIYNNDYYSNIKFKTREN